MADNVGYTPGTGEMIATDDIGGTHFQKVKQVWGADGVANEVTPTAPFPIAAYGELIEAIEAMRMAIQSLNRTLGLAQVNPTTGRMLVDASGTTQPISGNLNTISQVSLVANTQQISGQISVPLSLERGAADNLRRNIITT
jgi:hypothetical protein